ncbi:putative membrane protein [Orientia tsutsugamushi str. TA716]|uniref:Putative membrane protein n=1 Tax=Orientia tsutsugamushi str. TA716 TaxID=1359175 RepID=A0A0F3P5F1_ORITS|nr:putative membrane protein [Orientia tsutsugamushi str. TA716]
MKFAYKIMLVNLMMLLPLFLCSSFIVNDYINCYINLYYNYLNKVSILFSLLESNFYTNLFITYLTSKSLYQLWVGIHFSAIILISRLKTDPQFPEFFFYLFSTFRLNFFVILTNIFIVKVED